MAKFLLSVSCVSRNIYLDGYTKVASFKVLWEGEDSKEFDLPVI